MPACKKCNRTDPESFYPYQQNECKTCTRNRVKANRQERIDYYREFDRNRSNDPSRKIAFSAKTKRLRSTVKGMQHAHNAVNRAIKTGELTRPSTCSRCPADKNIQAHHDDHTRPLDVMWLCPVCHAARHKELGRLRTVQKIYGTHTNIEMPI